MLNILKRLFKVGKPPDNEDDDFIAEFAHLLLPDGSIDLSGFDMVRLNMETGEFEESDTE